MNLREIRKQNKEGRFDRKPNCYAIVYLGSLNIELGQQFLRAMKRVLAQPGLINRAKFFPI